MLELDQMHESVLQALLLSKYPDSKIYGLLPTAQNRKMSNYLKQWKIFNQTIIEHARDVCRTKPVCDDNMLRRKLTSS